MTYVLVETRDVNMAALGVMFGLLFLGSGAVWLGFNAGEEDKNMTLYISGIVFTIVGGIMTICACISILRERLNNNC